MVECQFVEEVLGSRRVWLHARVSSRPRSPGLYGLGMDADLPTATNRELFVVNDKTVLLFVHGTGVRGVSYASALELIEQKVRANGWPVTVRGCFWGGSEGANLSLGGASIPGYREAGGAAPSLEDEVLALWAVLYTDPWYELRLLKNFPEESFLPGREAPSTVLRRTLEEFAPSDRLRTLLASEDLAGFFEDALAALLRAPEFDQAIETAPSDPLEHRRAIARAVVARTLVAAEEADRLPLTGLIRDHLVEQLTTDLHGYGMGVGEFLLHPLKGLASQLITKKLVGNRGTVSDDAVPLAGDVLLYLAKGQSIRAYVTAALADHDGAPVVVLAHSLGGVICADLLVEQAKAKPKGGVGIAALVTVGTQVPLLYEIGALPSLVPPEQLPDRFPRWLNVYDRRDILSYIGGGVFGNRVTDIEVDNGEPFPRSHSAYWRNHNLWKAIEQVLP